MKKSKPNFCITYYDFANLNYASFFLAGFFENSKKFNYDFIVSKSTPIILQESNSMYKWNDILFSICLFKVEKPNDSYYFCIDTRDSNSSDESSGKGFHLPLLDKVKYYFKINYNSDIIQIEPELKRASDKIIPVLPFFPIKFNKSFLYLPKIIPLKVSNLDYKQLKGRLKFIIWSLTLDEVMNFRNFKKDRDLCFVSVYYNEKIHEAANEFRYQIVREIRKHKEINSYTGFVGSNLPGKYREFEIEGSRIRQYLGEIAKSKIVLYVRGMFNCISFKFAQNLALGMPMIGHKLINNTENLMQYNNFDLQFAYEDPKEIVERAIDLIKQPELLAELGRSNAEVFDKYFRPQSVVSEILGHILE
jgi:hypothetical protein